MPGSEQGGISLWAAFLALFSCLDGQIQLMKQHFSSGVQLGSVLVTDAQGKTSRCRKGVGTWL